MDEFHPMTAEQEALRAKRLKTALFVLAVFGAGALFVAAWVAVTFFGVLSRPPSAEERLLLVTVADLQENGWGFEDVNPTACETFDVITNLDGSRTVEYEYDSENDPENSDYLFLSSDAEIYPSPLGVKDGFNTTVVVMEAGMLLSESKLRSEPGLFTLGTRNYCAVLEQYGQTLGYIVVAQKGRIVYSLTLFGADFDDEKEALENLLRPHMQSEWPPPPDKRDEG